MWLNKSAHSAETAITSVSRILSNLGMGVLVVMMLLTVTDVFLRYVFSRPILGSVELTEYLMVCIVFLGLAWCAVRRGNARVDLMVSRFSPRVQAIFDSTTCLLSLGVLSLMAWQASLEVRDMWLAYNESYILKLPAYPFYLVLAIGLLMLCLVLVINLVQFVAQARRG